MRRHDRRRKPRKAHVRHILVANKPEAKMILEQINAAKTASNLQKNGQEILQLPQRQQGVTSESLWKVRWFRPSRMPYGHRSWRPCLKTHQNPIWIPCLMGAQHRASQ